MRKCSFTPSTVFLEKLHILTPVPFCVHCGEIKLSDTFLFHTFVSLKIS